MIIYYFDKETNSWTKEFHIFAFQKVQPQHTIELLTTDKLPLTRT
jgi:hypothetical protein